MTEQTPPVPPTDDADAILRPIIDDAQDPTVSAFAAWLVAESGPDDWHRSMMGWNWDADPEIIRWIVAQPRCDKATALMVFWKGQPEYYLPFADRGDVPGCNLEGLDLIEDVRGRWTGGFYTRSELAFDLADDAWPRDFTALDAEFGDRARDLLPLDMRAPLPGRRLEDVDGPEGIPRRFWPAEWWPDE